MSIFSKLKSGLAKTSAVIQGTFSKVFNLKKLDDAAIEEIEETLLLADVGTSTTKKVINELIKLAKTDSEIDESVITSEIKKIILHTLNNSEKKLETNKKPLIMLLAGVNGNGKTTTVAKLTHYFQAQNLKVLMVACDTFRAAAVAQLEEWSKRLGCGFFQGESNADPASVAYKGIHYGIAENFDVILLDTAGRLHNKSNLMDELSKIIKVIKKVDETFPHESIIVIDGTTGQNAINQVKEFSQILHLTGIIINKLDGTAKGGILIKIYDDFKIPILGVGVGEKLDDFKFFDPNDYTNNLLGIE